MIRTVSRFLPGILLVFLCLQRICNAQEKPLEPGLSDLVNIREWSVYNCIPQQLIDGDKKGVRFEGRKGGGMAWYPEIVFTNGVIE